jgi:glyoxylase-like metal-dependent hydrolase (beta-lactamase superfamily II)
MTISRKHFLKLSSIAAGSLFFPFRTFGESFFLYKPGFGNVRLGTGIYTEKGGTIGWYISDTAVIAIDTQSPETAENFRRGIKDKAKRNFDIVFNTHHHGDHTAGNYLLKDYTNKIVAHENCPKLQKQAYGTGEKADKQVYAETTFSEIWKTDISTDVINAIYLGPAHTGGDSIIYFEKADVAHVGDLVFNRTYPFIDPVGGGSIKEWIDVLEKAEKNFPDSTTFIFGHAKSDNFVTGTKDDILYMRDFLSALLEYVNKGIQSGQSLEEIKLVQLIPGFSEHTERWKGALQLNIEQAFNELNKK